MAENTQLQQLFERMGEFTKMESELPFAEFSSYYDDVIALLQRDYQQLDEDQLVQMKGITMIMSGNAKMRAMRKDGDRKRYLKIGEKTAFWEEAIALRLKKDGMDAETLEKRVDSLWSE